MQIFKFDFMKQMERNVTAQDLYKLFMNLGIDDAAEEIMKILPNSKTWYVFISYFFVNILDLYFLIILINITNC